jgi:transcriptional regulator with XRE-family HTH domain
MPDDALRSNLKRLLDEQNVSARSVSKKAGLSEKAVAHILHSRSKSPRYENVKAIAAALGVSEKELTGSAGRPPPTLAEFPQELVKDQAKLRLLRYWDRLSDEGRDIFLKQIMDSILSD